MTQKITVFISGFHTIRIKELLSRNEQKVTAINELSTLISSSAEAANRQNPDKNKKNTFFVSYFLNDDNDGVIASSLFESLEGKLTLDDMFLTQLKTSTEINFDGNKKTWQPIENKIKKMNSIISSFSIIQRKFLTDYYYDTEELKLGTNIIKIDIYFGCSELLTKLSEQDIGHLMIYKISKEKCFSDTLRSLNFNYSTAESLTVISDESFEDDIDETPIMHFFFKQNFMRIKKDSDTSLFRNRMEHWIKNYFHPPSCFFSYSEQDSNHQFMHNLEKSMKRYFNFLKIEKDKRPGNLYINLVDFQTNLANGDMVFCIIDKSYLEKFHPMNELLKTLEAKNLIMKDEFIEETEKYKDVIKRSFSGTGLFPIITQDAGDEYIYNNNNSLKLKWQALIKENSEKEKHNTLEMENIYINIEKIKKFLSIIYDHKGAEKHLNENFRNIAQEVSKVLMEKEYFNIYRKYNSDNFPRIQ